MEDELRPNVERVGAERASITCRTRWPDSPYVESIMHGRTLGADSPTRPAECHWHMVFAKKDGEVRVVFVGPWTTTGVAHYAEGAEILWIKYKLGAFMPHLPAGRFLDTETVLPGASSRSFWLKGSAWEFPDYENVETFVDRLVRKGVLVCDPLVNAVLRDRSQGLHPGRCDTASCGPPGCPKAAFARSSAPNRRRPSCNEATRSLTSFTRSAIAINRT